LYLCIVFPSEEKRVKISCPRGKVEYLTTDEVKVIQKKDLHCERLEQVRDLFLFQTGSGLSYSDMAGLTKRDIQQDEDTYYIRKNRHKTDIEYIAILLPIAVDQMLNEEGICLYVKNYNLETIINSKINPVASLICTILLEIASMERLTIAERMTSGRNQYIAHCRENGVKMGRPATYRKPTEAYKEQYMKELGLIRKGVSLRNVEKLTGKV